MLPRESDMRYNWILVRLDAIDLEELRELVIDAWRMCVPKRLRRHCMPLLTTAFRVGTDALSPDTSTAPPRVHAHSARSPTRPADGRGRLPRRRPHRTRPVVRIADFHQPAPINVSGHKLDDGSAADQWPIPAASPTSRRRRGRGRRQPRRLPIGLIGSPAARSSASTRWNVASCVCIRRVKPTV